jgi:Flp pilus assembly protein TadD
MKNARRIGFALLAVVVLVAIIGVKRVPPGFEAVRVARDGGTRVAAAGVHLAFPGTKFVRYPVGKHSFRVPADGAMPVRFQNGQAVDVAFAFDLDIAPGSSEKIYTRFSTDFPAAFERLVNSAAEIDAAAALPPDAPHAFARSVVAQAKDQLTSLGVTVTKARLLRWGDRSFESDSSLASGTAPKASRSPRRLVIVGIDGGDWQNLRPLIKQGKLPNFARLVKDGATGPLRSEEPMLSPLLWTTMATGRQPEKHGVLNFTVADPKTGVRVPISRLYRKVDAFWNILGDYGRTVAVIGWLATDPAEKVNGLVVTDKFGYLAYAPEDTAHASASSVYPPSRRDELSRLVVHGGQIPDSDIQKFVTLSPKQIDARRESPDPRDPVNNLIHLYASTLTFRNIAKHVLETDPPDVLAVYFEWVDAMSHLFMLDSPPRMPDVPADEYAMYKNVIEQVYVVQDEILGEFMNAIDEHTVLMVVSDHGFKSGDSRLHNRPEIWAGNAAKWHRIDGIIGFYGAGVTKGAPLDGASILDVAPTVLALAGLPRAKDMPGDPIAMAFADTVVSTFSPEILPTLDRKRESTATSTTDAATTEQMKKLEALGYLTPDNADAHNNLGQRYQQQGEFQKAIDEYKKAIAMRPNFHGAYNNLAVCYGKLKMFPQAEEALEKCISLKPDDFYAMNNLAVMYIQTGRTQDGVAMAEKAVKIEPGYANGRVTLGSLYAMTRRYDEAETQFREALKIDPENHDAKVNLEKLQRVRGSQ